MGGQKTYELMVEIGHKSTPLTKKLPNGYTHKWTAFVRGANNSKIEHCIQRVVFQLHESFENPQRELTSPPYQVKETGYAGFEIPIQIYFKNKDKLNFISFVHDLNLLQNKPNDQCSCERLKFISPSKDFERCLLKSGAQLLSSKKSRPTAESPPTKRRKSSSLIPSKDIVNISLLSSTNGGSTSQSRSASQNHHHSHHNNQNHHHAQSQSSHHQHQSSQSHHQPKSSSASKSKSSNSFIDLFGNPLLYGHKQQNSQQNHQHQQQLLVQQQQQQQKQMEFQQRDSQQHQKEMQQIQKELQRQQREQNRQEPQEHNQKHHNNVQHHQKHHHQSQVKIKSENPHQQPPPQQTVKIKNENSHAKHSHQQSAKDDLLILRSKILSLSDRDQLQRIVDIVEEQGEWYNISSSKFEFDLKRFDKKTISRIEDCLLENNLPKC